MRLTETTSPPGFPGNPSSACHGRGPRRDRCTDDSYGAAMLPSTKLTASALALTIHFGASYHGLLHVLMAVGFRVILAFWAGSCSLSRAKPLDVVPPGVRVTHQGPQAAHLRGDGGLCIRQQLQDSGGCARARSATTSRSPPDSRGFTQPATTLPVNASRPASPRDSRITRFRLAIDLGRAGITACWVSNKVSS